MLKQLREDRNISQTEVSRRVGLAQPRISQIESGLRRMDLIELLDILKALEVDPLEFIKTVLTS